jgi:hypothetical protein
MAAFARGILERMFRAKKEDPEKWLGPEYMPRNPEHDRWLKIGKRLLKRIEGKQDPRKPDGRHA